MMSRVFLVVAALCCLCAIQGAYGASILGVDLGSGFFKVAVIRGNTFEVVMNEESARKTPTIVGFQDDGARVFGMAAQNLAMKKPSQVIRFAPQLLGKRMDHPWVKANAHWYPDQLVELDNGGVGLKVNDTLTITPEELTAMLLTKAQSMGKAFLNSHVKDVVITVPSEWTHHERRAMERAASLAGLNVLGLVNDLTAVAVDYAFFGKSFEETQIVTFFDMGESTTKAAVVLFANVVSAKTNKTSPQMQVLSQAMDSSLGARDFDERLVQHLARLANDALNVDVFSNSRAMGKLRKEARRVKEVLSANHETDCVIQALMNDLDFRVTVTREAFEDLCADLWPAMLAPATRALAMANVTVDQLHAVEVTGGGIRMPKANAMLAEFVQRSTLDHHLNGDEAAVMGAAFNGVMRSIVFKSQDLTLRDLAQYPVSIRLPEHIDTPSHERSLFRGRGRRDIRRQVTFRTDQNVTLDLFYNTTDTEFPLPEGTESKISSYSISGLPTTDKYNFTGQPKMVLGIKLDGSGLLSLESAEAEIMVTTIPKPKKVPKKKKATKPTIEPAEPETGSETGSETDSDSTDSAGSDDDEGSATPEAPEGQGDADSMPNADEKDTTTSQQDNSDAKEGDTATDTGVETEEEQEEEVEVIQPKPVKKKKVIKLKVKHTSHSPVEPTKEDVSAMKSRLRAFDREERARLERQKALNELESSVYAGFERVHEDDFITYSTEEERETMSTKLDELMEWVEDEAWTATTSQLKAKLAVLKGLQTEPNHRMREAKKRPKAIKSCQKKLNSTLFLLDTNVTQRLEVEQDEVDEAVAKIEETLAWIKEREAEQAELAENVDPAFTVWDLDIKCDSADRRARALLRKPRRKPPAKADEGEDGDDAGDDEADMDATDGTDEEDVHVDSEDNDADAQQGEGDADGGDDTLTQEEQAEALDEAESTIES